MLYAVGGIAWAGDKYQASGSYCPGQCGLATFDVNAKETRTGYVVGAGLAALFGANWSGFVEYNFMDFGTRRVTLSGTGTLNDDP